MRWGWPVRIVLWTITVGVVAWSTWPPAYVSRDDVDAGVPGGVRPELVVADANTANRLARGTALGFALKLWVVPIGVVGVGYVLMVAYRARAGDLER